MNVLKQLVVTEPFAACVDPKKEQGLVIRAFAALAVLALLSFVEAVKFIPHTHPIPKYVQLGHFNVIGMSLVLSFTVLAYILVQLRLVKRMTLWFALGLQQALSVILIYTSIVVVGVSTIAH